MARNKQTRLLEIYKLHSILADQVSNRREGANRLYVSLLVGLLSVLAIIIKFGPAVVADWEIFIIVGLFGTLLSFSWWSVIQSYQRLNREKFRVLHDLEKKLPFRFFKQEWDPGNVGGRSNDYIQLTRVESLLPMLFGLFFLGVFAYGLIGTCQ